MRVYLDANASEPLRPAARASVLAAMEQPGNPSSIHADGRTARRMLEDAREAVARRFGAAPAQVVFTSGGTEADALAIHALGQGRRLIIGATEHDAVRAAAPSAEILPVNAEGVADLDALARLLEGSPALVCLMLANNETGAIQPIADAAALCHQAGALLHVDAAQAAGRMAIDMRALGADSLAISAHKLGGPQGAGALLVAPFVSPNPLIRGGGQERGWRGGTPSLPAIAGLGAAAAEAPVDLSALRDALEQAAQDCGAEVIGRGAARLGNTSCLGLPGVAAQMQVMALDLAGIAVSAGAACSSGKIARSHVLEAMGLGTIAGEAIRVSLPWNASTADVEAFIVAYRAMAARLSRSVA
jgi:cysteine desulfurase